MPTVVSPRLRTAIFTSAGAGRFRGAYIYIYIYIYTYIHTHTHTYYSLGGRIRPGGLLAATLEQGVADGPERSAL